MTRSRTWLAACLLALGAGAGGALAAPVAGPAPLEHVVVTLNGQASLSGIAGSRPARLREVIRRRHAKADSGYAAFAARLAAWRQAGRITAIRRFWVFNGFAISATRAVIDALATDPAVARVTPDAATIVPTASGPVESNVALVGAPALWDLGDTGQGVVVATLDSGVDLDHPDLAGSWRGGTNSWYDPFGQQPTVPTDLTGHGTEVMGVIVGGAAGGTAVGIAPGARWIAARIFNDQGQSTISATHAAFQWLLDPDGNPATADAPEVVNSSWSFSGGVCNLEFAPDIQSLRAAGILPVFAAGNFGSVSASPANNPGAFAVGSTTRTNAIASDSSRGPSACGEASTTFPELTAPGVGIRTTDLGGLYATQSGTSMAAPHVAGALALLLSAHPDLTAAQQEAAVEQSAVDLGAPGPDNVFGHGRLDILAAYGSLIGPPPPDTTGPVVSGVATTPELTADAPVVLTATAADSTDTTAAAEWFDGTDPGAGNGTAMTAADGAFDQPSETLVAIVDSPALSSGAHAIGVRARDAAGNWGATMTTTLVVDHAAPGISTLSVTPTPTVGAANTALGATATDPAGPAATVAGAEWFDGADPGAGYATAMAAADGAFDEATEVVTATVDTSALMPGAHTIAVRARDAAGNWGATSSVTMTVSSPPAGTLSGAPGGGMSINPPTVAGPFVLGSRPLRFGMRGPDVRRLQRILRGRGLAVTVSGTYGPRTRRAVRALQRRWGLRATGVANAAFFSRLGIRPHSIPTTVR